MADTKISALTGAASLNGAMELAVNDAGTSKKILGSDIADYTKNSSSKYNASVSTPGAGFSSDTYISGSGILIPAPSVNLKAKSVYRCLVAITKGAAGTGTPTVNIRYGTAGTTGDTSRCLFTWPAANTAVADEMWVEIRAIFRTVGSGTSAVIQGALRATHRLTTTGFGGTGQGADIFLNTTGGGFDSTVASSQIGISINGSTGASWTIPYVEAELVNLANLA